MHPEVTNTRVVADECPHAMEHSCVFALTVDLVESAIVTAAHFSRWLSRRTRLRVAWCIGADDVVRRKVSMGMRRLWYERGKAVEPGRVASEHSKPPAKKCPTSPPCGGMA